MATSSEFRARWFVKLGNAWLSDWTDIILGYPDTSSSGVLKVVAILLRGGFWQNF